VASGRKRGGIRRRGWLHRASHHRSEQSVVASDAAGADRDEGESGAGRGEGGGHGDVRDGGGGGAPAGPDTQASLDQVLRSAAEARDKGTGKDGAG
jgi:hypothetical protein